MSRFILQQITETDRNTQLRWLTDTKSTENIPRNCEPLQSSDEIAAKLCTFPVKQLNSGTDQGHSDGGGYMGIYTPKNQSKYTF